MFTTLQYDVVEGARNVCWMDLNGWGNTDDSPQELADECRMLRERSVAGISDTIPACPVHPKVPVDSR